ncbi:FAD-binding protein [Desertimonas flava]|uniref:FAD-binding protein n=1 Tax=Desertimonas flava TaxID=2064846 RepID=UPI000E34846C|nr:FAD-binding oxidoreductase [Desertimonas flava]
MPAGTSGRRLLTGWGGTAASATEVVRASGGDLAGLLGVVRSASRRGVIARGLGRSYGDSAQNGGGLAVELEQGPETINIDARTATATVGAGVSIDDLLRASVPAGLFVPVTPGTRFVTVGGAIASDIHGKNHHVDGTFGRHVRSLRLLLADGDVVELSPDQRPDLFWATVGGMGLTGIILEATVAMLPIETSRCTVDTERVADLDSLLAHMDADDDAFRYSVAWIDPMASGRSLGRSILTRGDHARVDELPPRQVAGALEYRPGHLATIPPVVPGPGVMNHATISAFNEMWYRKAPRRRVGQIMSIPQFFHPLDAVGHWNRLYGRRGFVQYQFVVPFGEETALRNVIERLADARAPSFLAVLKRFGAANPAPLSFPRPGWTLAVDVPAATSGLAELLTELDRLVLDAGGRHYLAKDSATTPEAIRRGYPRLGEWRTIRDAADPIGRWVSDQSRRLRLTA